MKNAILQLQLDICYITVLLLLNNFVNRALGMLLSREKWFESNNRKDLVNVFAVRNYRRSIWKLEKLAAKLEIAVKIASIPLLLINFSLSLVHGRETFSASSLIGRQEIAELVVTSRIDDHGSKIDRDYSPQQDTLAIKNS